MSSDLLRAWIQENLDAKSLKYLNKESSLGVCLVPSGQGPKSILRQQTQGYIWHSQTNRYGHTFANLVVAFALKHKGRAQALWHDLIQHFVSQGCPCAWLLTAYRDSANHLVDEIMQQKPVRDVTRSLADVASDNGEFKLLVHDATFKIMFSIIGQTERSQTDGEAHA